MASASSTCTNIYDTYDSPIPGYDMSAMSEDVYEEAIADIVDSESMLTDASIVKVCL